MTCPPTWTVSTGLTVPWLRSSSSTDISWLSALDTYTQVAAEALPAAATRPHATASAVRSALAGEEFLVFMEFSCSGGEGLRA